MCSEPSKSLVASEAKKAQDAASWEAVPAGGPNANGHRQGQLQAPKSDKLGKGGETLWKQVQCRWFYIAKDNYP